MYHAELPAPDPGIKEVMDDNTNAKTIRVTKVFDFAGEEVEWVRITNS